MININKEAEEYAENELKDKGSNNDKLICKIDFIAGANSKYVQAEKLKFAIEQLYKFRESTFGKGVDVIKDLKKQLKELEK